MKNKVSVLLIILSFLLVAAKPITQGEFSIQPVGNGPFTVDTGVRFDVTTPPLKNYEYYAIRLNCYQNGVLLYGRALYDENELFLGGTDSGSFEPQRWDGPADCIGEVWIYTRPLSNQQQVFKASYSLIIQGD